MMEERMGVEPIMAPNSAMLPAVPEGVGAVSTVPIHNTVRVSVCIARKMQRVCGRRSAAS